MRSTLKSTLTLLLMLAALLLAKPIQAQDTRQLLYRAYVTEDMEKWEDALAILDSSWVRGKNDSLAIELLEANYGYTAWLIALKRKDDARPVISRSLDMVYYLENHELASARVYALKGAFYGFRLLVEMRNFMHYGRQSFDANEKAMELDPGEPQVWLERGNIDYYKPRIFGGSKKEARLSYMKAVELFEKDPERIAGNWVYLNTLAGLGLACDRTRHDEQAAEVYRKILEIEPDFKWVAQDLYPAFQEKNPEH